MRIVGIWLVTTTVTVLGVAAAIDRVAGEVNVARPAPMTASEVDQQLRERQRSAPTATTTVPPAIGPIPSSEPRQPTSGTDPTSNDRTRPDEPDRSGSGDPRAGSTTTVASEPSGRQGERAEEQRP